MFEIAFFIQVIDKQSFFPLHSLYKVYNFDYFCIVGSGEVMEKITMQDIADALHISRVTVSKAFNDQAGVSDTLRELIFEKARELGYARIPAHTPAPVQREEKTISLIVSSPYSAVFWTSIIHRMAQELSNYNMNLLYTYVPSVYTPDFTLPPILLNGDVDGIVVLNVYDHEILRMVNRLPLPKVFLDTVPTLSDLQLNGDLLVIEGYRTVYEITATLLEKGLCRIGFLGNVNYAQTNMERYRGYLACMKEHRLPVIKEYCMTAASGRRSYIDDLEIYLSELSDWPEAFVCVNDYTAHYVKQYMSHHATPHPVILTGFDNTIEYANVYGQITTADVPTGLLGKRLTQQISFRTENPDAPYELTFIRPSIIFPEQQED